MSNSFNKHEEFQFWGQEDYVAKNILTSKQACNILNNLSLKYNFSEEDLEEINVLKEWIWKR